MRKKWISTGIIIMIVCLVFAGCGSSSEESTEENSKQERAAAVSKGNLKPTSTVVAVGKTEVSYAEYMVYSYLLKSQYEDVFTDQVWSYHLGDQMTIGMEALEEIVRMITEMKIIANEAEKQEVVLAVEEKEEVESRTAAFLEAVSDDFINEYGITENIVNTVYHDNEIARKMYDIITGTLTDTITQEMARRVQVTYLFLNTKGMDEKEKKGSARTAASFLNTAKKRKNNFITFAQMNTDDTQVQKIVGAETEPEPFAKAAMSLKKGQFSDVIESTDGYYILYCDNPNCKDETEQKYDELLKEGQDNLFKQKYEEWLLGYEVRVSTGLNK